jgi:hypothetical protein
MATLVSLINETFIIWWQNKVKERQAKETATLLDTTQKKILTETTCADTAKALAQETTMDNSQMMKVIAEKLAQTTKDSLENDLDLGVTSNFDTGPMESNHKINAKNPSKRTQMRAEGFEEGTAHWYIEDLVLDVASHELSRVLLQICKGHPTHHGNNSLLQGAKYTITFGATNLEHDLRGEVTLSWDKHHVVTNGYNDTHIQWLCNHSLLDLGQLAQASPWLHRAHLCHQPRG